VINIDDKYLARVRSAQKETGSTRVVLDLNCSCVFVPVLSRTPPFALMLTVQPSDAAPDHPADHVEVTARENAPSPEVLKPTPEPLARAADGPIRIAIDPGHGGWDKGTVGSKGLQEKELVLAIAQRLGHLVAQKLGGEVVFTRSDDTFVPLQSRANLANTANADLLISIHGNSSPYRSVRGIETFVAASPGKVVEAADARMTESRKLARAVQHFMFARLAEADPGLHDRGVKSAPLVVLAESTMPSVLIELSFVSSPIEEHKLMDPAYRDQIASALFDGISSYLSSRKKATNSAHLQEAVQPFGN
jgi:N-acetylmuramoyl-L-alanine amidase